MLNTIVNTVQKYFFFFLASFYEYNLIHNNKDSYYELNLY